MMHPRSTRLVLLPCLLALTGCGLWPRDEKPPAADSSVKGAPADASDGEPAPPSEPAPAAPRSIVWEPAEVESPSQPAAADASPRAASSPATASAGLAASLEILREIPDGAALDDAAKAKLQDIMVPQPEPQQSRDLEIALMHKGIYFRDTPLYDGAWRNMPRPKGWDEQHLREMARQWDRPYEVLIEGPRAITFYRDAPELGPTFLRRKSIGWMIDGSQTARIIVYDHSDPSGQRWYAVESSGPYFALLQRALPMRSVTLPDGRSGWEPTPSSEPR
jgi:hypothetical protein